MSKEMQENERCQPPVPGAIRIVSDGTPLGTRVVGVDQAYNAVIVLNVHDVPRATIDVHMPQVDVVVRNPVLREVCPYCGTVVVRGGVPADDPKAFYMDETNSCLIPDG